MPTQPKKKRTSTTSKKKSTSKRRTVRPKTRRRKKKSNLKKNIFVFFGVLFVISLVAFGYFLGNNSTPKPQTVQSKILEEDHYNTKEFLNDLSKILVTESSEIKKEKPSVKYAEIKKAEKKPHKEKEQKRVATEKKKVQTKKVVFTSGVKKPRLAIIIDDVSNKTQLKRIQDTGLKLTPSIFPPSELSMTSHKLARTLKHYMIHLPMESGNAKFNTQHKTLLVNSSYYTVEQRVKEIRRLFPNAKYINNHTGSVFTADYNAMYKLYKALDREGFIFIDSRTSNASKVQKITKEFGNQYISRDIFIDNEHNVPYIHDQLKEAVNFAKKKGYAIAIGHPHRVTMEALQQAKTILSDVEIVYIDEMFKN